MAIKAKPAPSAEIQMCRYCSSCGRYSYYREFSQLEVALRVYVSNIAHNADEYRDLSTSWCFRTNSRRRCSNVVLSMLLAKLKASSSRLELASMLASIADLFASRSFILRICCLWCSILLYVRALFRYVDGCHTIGPKSCQK